MLMPYVLLMAVLFYTFAETGKEISIEKPYVRRSEKAWDPRFKSYIVAVFFNTLGLIPVYLIQYIWFHFFTMISELPEAGLLFL
jgi:hypothetical protein